MKRSLFLFVGLMLFLIGAGCNNSSTNTTDTSTSSLKTVIKKPTTVSLEEQAYDRCLSEGYKVGIQEEDGTSIAYCVFGNNTACPLLLFGNNTCSIAAGTIVYADAEEQQLQNLRACDETLPSVCGTNKKTYVNQCIAELQQVSILHEGNCTAEEIASVAVSDTPQTVTPTNKKPTNSGSVQPTTSGGTATANTTKPSQETGSLPISNEIPNTPAPQAQWLSMLIDLTLASGPSTPRAFIEYCNYGKPQVYYFEQGGQPTFSALYDKNGTIICYPDNDVNNSCPSYFIKNKRSANCIQVWKDKR